MKRKYNYDTVYQDFKNNGCELLSKEYKNPRTLLNYRCSCGEESCITYDNFRRGTRCKKCGLGKLSSKFRHDYNFVKEAFKEQGCELLTKEYINSNQLLSYICVCGQESKISFNNFKKGKLCKACGIEKFSSTIRRNYSEVFTIFEKENCKLLSTSYINDRTDLEYICECGSKAKIKLIKFLQGQRCRECGIKKNSGENHHNWSKDLTNEDRVKGRKIPGLQKWRKEVFERDNYKCVKCGEENAEEYNAHHIRNYSNYEEGRLKVRNGATLCKKCHIDFHVKHGYTNNTQEQFYNWMAVD